MNKIRYTALTAALGLIMSGSAIGLTKPEYKAAKDEMSAKYKADKNACKPMSGNAKDICMEEAKGRDKVAKSELEARHEPSEKHTKDVRMTKAKAAYDVAKEKCDDLKGNAKDVCVKEAKAGYVAAKADTNVAATTADPNASKSAKVEAKKDAASDKRDADYAVAKEKCDAMSSDAKTSCIKSAKVKFGQT